MSIDSLSIFFVEDRIAHVLGRAFDNRYSYADACRYMRTLVVVKAYKPSYAFFCFLYASIERLAIKLFGLDNTIDALGYAVIGRLVIFSHTNAYMVVVQLLYISITAVLHSTVRVMDQLR